MNNAAASNDGQGPKPDPKIGVIVKTCFNEAIADARDEITRSGFSLDNVEGLKTPMQSLTSRVAAWGKGPYKRVPFDRLVKARMKREFPEFKVLHFPGASETLEFAKPITDSTNLLLVIDKIYGHGLGKTFSLLVGAEFKGPHVPWYMRSASAFILYQRMTMEWTYNLQEDLERDLGGLAHVIGEIAPPLENAFMRWLPGMPKCIPPGVPSHVGYSARDAFALAANIARHWDVNPYLGHIGGQGISEAGRLTESGKWKFGFDDPNDGEIQLFVIVPGVGRIQWYSAILEGTRAGQHLPLSNWVDSPDVWARACQIGRNRFGPKHTLNYGDLFTVDIAARRQEWQVQLRGALNEPAATVTFDANDLSVEGLR